MMEDILITPATAIFIDTLNFQNAFTYLVMGSPILPPWFYPGFKAIMILLSLVCSGLMAVLVTKWRVYRTSSQGMRILIMAVAMGMWHIGVTKSIINKASADDETTIIAADACVTNGVSRVYVEALNGKPEPMWYRNAKDQSWILATDDGWILMDALDEGNFHTREWTHSSTNKEVTAWNMWHFGENPPAVEIIESGGVHITGFKTSGKYVQITWKIDSSVELNDNSVLTIERADSIVDGSILWTTVLVERPPVHGERTYICPGFHLGKRTLWRIRLEVAE